MTICTEPFAITAQAIAASYGAPTFDVALTGHPVASLSGDEVQQRARELVPRVLELLGVGRSD